MIPRFLEKVILEKLPSSNKIFIILGARQVGKTTLLKFLSKKLETGDKKLLYLNCDLEEDSSAVDTTSLVRLQKLIDDSDYVFIDEAQRLENPGLTLKIIHDHFNKTRVIVTGSSSFNLKNRLSDALTGRYLDFTLYPLSLAEILSALKMSTNPVIRKKQADALLDSVLLSGLYPEVYSAAKQEDKIQLLDNLIESYLFKDVFAFQKVRYPQAIQDLTRALAYQAGFEINENELATRLKIDRKTVVNYLDLLAQSFVIVRVFPYSKNPRREIGKKYKVYFADMGVRNALIGDFNPVRLRNDLGSVWENFLILERLKLYANQGRPLNYHFWRTYGGAEVDYLERPSVQKEMKAFEIKYTQTNLSRGARLFSERYKLPVQVVNQENYLEFIA